MFRLNRFSLVQLFLFSLGILFIATFLLGHSQYVFAFNNTTHTWTFNAINAPNFTYDPALVTIDTSGARPVTGANKIINPAFTINNSSWSLAAVAGSSTPAGWVVVPGNSTYSTNDFLVMKYEAKCAANTSPNVGLTAPDWDGYNTYTDYITPCTSANSKQVVSLASGYPIAQVTKAGAITRCATVPIGSSVAHLITNNEWQTIARNAEVQATNWSLGAIGSGYLFAGHNDISPDFALVASPNDSGNYACAYTDDAGITEAPSDCPTNTASDSSGTVGNQKRVLLLSNGQPIWDIAGNVVEWTSDTIQKKDQPIAWNGTADITAVGYSDYASGSSSRYIHTYKAGSPLQQVNIGPLNTTYNAKQGIGRIYHYSYPADINTTIYVFLRGGGWSEAPNAGAFSAFLNITPGTLSSGIGFRCASDPVVTQAFSSSSGRGETGGNSVIASSLTDAKIYQTLNVGDASTYDFSAYVHDSTNGNIGGTISSSIAQLYYNGTTIATTYTDAGAGWWKLSGTLTGADASREYGVFIKSGKTVVVDDFTLSKSGIYSAYANVAYSNAKTFSWDSFTSTVTASGNANVGYQICLDDSTNCSYTSGSRWQYYTGGIWTNATDATQTNTGEQITEVAMQALPTASKKITVKGIMGFGGEDIAAITSIAIGVITDILPPTVPSAPTTTSPTSNDTPTWAWASSTDSDSGLATTPYTVQWCQDSGFVGCGGNISTTASASFTHTTALADGTWYLRVKAKDLLNNESTYSSNGQGVVDTIAPTISITNLGLISNVPDKTSLMYYFTSQTPYIQVITEANSAVHFEYNGNDYTANAGADGKCAILISNPDLPGTSVILKYYSKDQAGNKSAERKLTLVIGIENFPTSDIGTLSDTTPSTTTPTLPVTDTQKLGDVTPTPILTTITTFKIEDESGNLLVNATVIINKQKYVSDSKAQIYLEGTPSSNSQISVEYDSKQAPAKILGNTIISTFVSTIMHDYTWLIVLAILAGLGCGSYLYWKKRRGD